MHKIPTIFDRDWDGDRSRVLDKPLPECQWVFDGEGVATRKYDGTCVAIIDGNAHKRYEQKVDRKTGELKPAPATFRAVQVDEETGNIVGWVLIEMDDPANRWFWEAWEKLAPEARIEGTYELLGPKINANPEGLHYHRLVAHDSATVIEDAPLDFNQFERFFAERDIEGIVWHHPDGRMAKIKARDFGVKRSQAVVV